MQQRDTHGRKIDPPSVRATVRISLPSSLVGVDEATALAMLTGKGIDNESHTKELVRRVRFGYDAYHGIKQTDKEVWDLAIADVASDLARSGRRRQPGTATTVIAQRWLRDIVLTWARTTDPDGRHLTTALRACTLASRASAGGPAVAIALRCCGWPTWMRASMPSRHCAKTTARLLRRAIAVGSCTLSSGCWTSATARS